MVCIFCVCVFFVSVLYSAESALNFRLPPGCKKIGPSCILISSPLVWSTQKWTDEIRIEQVRCSDQMFSRISQTWWAHGHSCTCNQNHGLHAARCFRTRWTSHRGHDDGWWFEHLFLPEMGAQDFFCQFLSCTASNSWMESDLFTACLLYLWLRHASRKNLPLWCLNYIMLRSDAGMTLPSTGWQKQSVHRGCTLYQKSDPKKRKETSNKKTVQTIPYFTEGSHHISRRFGSSSQSRWPRLNSAELVWRVWSCVLGLEFTNGSFL